MHVRPRSWPPAEGPPEFAALYREHRQRLYAFCYRLTRNPTSAEDLVQDTFAKAFRRISQFDAARPFWPWLAAIAARTCIDGRRRDTYAEARLAQLEAGECSGGVDPTATAVIGRMESEALERELATLPTRQRMALQLFALDGWSYPEIAGQLGCTVASVKQLIVRARTRMRHAGARALGALGMHLRTLGGRVQQLLDRLPGWAGVDAAPGWSQALVGLAVTSVLVAGVGVGVVRAPREDRPVTAAAAALEAFDVPASPQSTSAASHPPAARSSNPPAEPPLLGRQQDVERAVHAAVAASMPAAHDSAEAPPEERMQADGFTVSPAYEDDHTVYALGATDGPGSTVLVSRDGGARWEQAEARGLQYSKRLLLPPAYPDDNRMFAVNMFGMQVSHNGGESFETLPITIGEVWDASLSPAFDDGHPAILVTGTAGLYEYRVDTGRLRPVVLQAAGLTARIDSARYAASYPVDPTIFVTTRTFWAARPKPPTVYRCRVVDATLVVDAAERGAELNCDEETALPGNGVYPIDLRQPDGAAGTTLFARAGQDVYTSTDDGRSFRQVRRATYRQYAYGWDLEHSGEVRDLAVARRDGRTVAVVAQGRGVGAKLPPLERTDDGGATWTPLVPDVSGFEVGALAVAMTPSGRILAGGSGRGLACSVDGGLTWARTCAVPEA